MQKIKNEYMEGIRILEMKNSSLYNKYIELKDLFEKRPPREEDMEMIFKLREELMTKDKLLKGAEENMEYFRNELINREELYNKYFGTNPKVGYINPLKAKESDKNANGTSKVK